VAPARPFVVHVARLRRAAATRWNEQRQGPIVGLECSGSTVPEDETPMADVVLECVLGGVSVTGTVEAPWTGECRRCLTRASGLIRVAVRELYTEDGDGNETYPIVNDEVDLEPLVRDAVLLELPPAPLCDPDCRGLCPVCGVNRNEEVCQCEAQRDPRWSALDVLRAPEGVAEAETESSSPGPR
jgi:uncharacterized protein